MYKVVGNCELHVNMLEILLETYSISKISITGFFGASLSEPHISVYSGTISLCVRTYVPYIHLYVHHTHVSEKVHTAYICAYAPNTRMYARVHIQSYFATAMCAFRVNTLLQAVAVSDGKPTTMQEPRTTRRENIRRSDCCSFGTC